ncbi:MAG: 50S ribosomal protein L7/L12 [Minisyncoccia bacterium]|jgi:large subunit ribosomal protein L7/L12
MANYDDLITKIESLTAMELAELVKKLEEKFGISAAAPITAGAGAGAAAAEEKTSFNVVLKSGGASKLNVIKVVREVTTLGLKEAKDLVDGAPKTVKENVKKEEAEEIKKKLEAAGAQAEIQ